LVAVVASFVVVAAWESIAEAVVGTFVVAVVVEAMKMIVEAVDSTLAVVAETEAVSV